MRGWEGAVLGGLSISHEVLYNNILKKLMAAFHNILTYLLHGAVLLEKLTGLQLVKKFPEFYGT